MAATALRQGPVQRSQVLGIDALRVVAEDLDPGALRRVARAHGEPETAREVTDGQQNDEHLLSGSGDPADLYLWLSIFYIYIYTYI